MYVITLVGKPGLTPRTMSNISMSHSDIQGMCARLAETMWRVNLHEAGPDGVLSVSGAWEGGKRKRKVAVALPMAPVITEESQNGHVPTEEDEGILSDAQAAQDALDEMHSTYNGYCVKCHEKRDFHATDIKTMDNGARRAVGICPVCNTGMNRILPKEKPEGEGGTTPEFSDGESGAS